MDPADRELRTDRDARALLVTGAGKAFCSGGDTGWIGSEPDAPVDHLRTRMIRFYRQWVSLRDLEIPTIAAVNGAAVGAGLCLALACDLRYAAPQAKARCAVHVAGDEPWHGGDLAAARGGRSGHGPRAAAHRPDRAGRGGAELGLVNRVLPEDGFLDAATDIAATIAAAAPIPTRYTTTALRQGGHASFEAAVQWEALAQPITLATADLQEGLAAAREKRRPAFTGR